MLLTTRSRMVQEKIRTMPQRQMELRDMARHKIDPYRPAWAVLPDGVWRNEPAFLIGGGPSLIGFDFNRLRGRGHIIAINRAFEFVPFADILFFMDYNFYRMCHEEPVQRRLWDQFQGIKVFLNLMGRKFEDVYSLRSLGRRGISDSLKTGLYHGNNSGSGAVQLAMALGARPIYLLGYDMRHENGQSHFHSGYAARQPERVVTHFIQDFSIFADSPKAQGRGIINLNPLSALRIFPFSTIDEVLNGPSGKGVGNDEHALRQPVLLDSSVAN